MINLQARKHARMIFDIQMMSLEIYAKNGSKTNEATFNRDSVGLTVVRPIVLMPFRRCPQSTTNVYRDGTLLAVASKLDCEKTVATREGWSTQKKYEGDRLRDERQGF